MKKEKYRILVLDDNDAVRESIVNFFEDHSYQVLAAATAEEALEILKTKDIDGVVVDIRLPGMDGNTFIRKAARRKPGLAFVIVTYAPDYQLPADIGHLSQISPYIFAKPVNDLAALEQAVFTQIINCRNQKI